MVDTNYIAANQNNVPIPGLDPNILCRYKWVEVLARIAQSKYMLTNKICSYMPDAVEKLFQEVLLKNY